MDAGNFKRKVLSSVDIDGIEMLSGLSLEEQVLLLTRTTAHVLPAALIRASLSLGQDTLLDKLTERAFAADETIIAQGSENSAFYIIRLVRKPKASV